MSKTKCRFCGKQISDLGIVQHERYCLSDPDRYETTKQWFDDNVADDGYAPTTGEYRDAAKKLGLPSVEQLTRQHGSWRGACDFYSHKARPGDLKRPVASRIDEAIAEVEVMLVEARRVSDDYNRGIELLGAPRIGSDGRVYCMLK